MTEVVTWQNTDAVVAVAQDLDAQLVVFLGGKMTEVVTWQKTDAVVAVAQDLDVQLVVFLGERFLGKNASWLP